MGKSAEVSSKKKDFKMLFKLATDKVEPSEGQYGLESNQQETTLGGDQLTFRTEDKLYVDTDEYLQFIKSNPLATQESDRSAPEEKPRRAKVERGSGSKEGPTRTSLRAVQRATTQEEPQQFFREEIGSDEPVGEKGLFDEESRRLSMKQAFQRRSNLRARQIGK